MSALHDALNAATDDTARAALIAAATDDERATLEGELIYQHVNADIANPAIAEFQAQLAAAADDATRLALIRAASRELRDELADSLWWDAGDARSARGSVSAYGGRATDERSVLNEGVFRGG